MISLIEIDFDQYIQKLKENDSTTDSSEKFQNLLSFVKKKCSDDFNLLDNNVEKGEGKGKGKDKDKEISPTILNIKTKISKSGDILEIIANDMTCPIGLEPIDQLCVLKCQHILALNNLKKLKQKICPNCREKIEDNEIRYLPQNSIYKNLYTKFFESGHILPSIELEDNYSDSSDSEVDLMLSKKKKMLKAIKFSPNKSLKSIFQIGRKQHPTYISAIKELEEKNYKNAEHWCKEFLKTFPESYSIRCILSYTYRCLNNYDQGHLYLNEAIKLKEKMPNAWYIRGEIHLRQENYNNAVRDLMTSINYNAKINNLFIMLGISYQKEFENALKNFKIALQNDPNNYFCLKYCAYIYEKQGEYFNAIKILNKLLSINEGDSLILCYYGEILSNIGKHNDAIFYFTKAANIDPESVHNLNRRAIAYFVLQKYDEALLDLNKVIQLDYSNSLAYCCKGLTYYAMKDVDKSIMAFEKCIELNPKDNSQNLSNIDDISNYFKRIIINIELKKYEDAEFDLSRLLELNDISFAYLLQKYSGFWSYLCNHLFYLDDCARLGIINEFEIYMYKKQHVYFMTNIMNLNNNNNYQFQESNLNRCILSFKDNNLSLPEFSMVDLLDKHYDIIWKINIKQIFSSDCFIKFIIEKGSIKKKQEYVLKYEDILNLEGLGWIEYVLFQSVNLVYYRTKLVQLSIEKDFVDMEIEYVRFTNKHHERRIHFPEMGCLFTNNVPEVFEDKYFSRKDVENFLELKDIISDL
uniref:Uncharacterized protein n=1 Tax=Rhizophagus irregularis (strain DAOM 181602 / DAOM 197198 / MUCL 43194) TaxID=747089 RepID=U9TY52_RHIID